MAVTVLTKQAGATQYIANVIATADADTDAVCPHGLGVVPDFITITLGGPGANAAGVRLAEWVLTALDSTNMTITKNPAAGTGQAARQVRVMAAVPHTLTR